MVGKRERKHSQREKERRSLGQIEHTVDGAGGKDRVRKGRYAERDMAGGMKIEREIESDINNEMTLEITRNNL